MRTACERHDVGSGSIYTWRRQAMSGELAGVRKLAEPAFAEVQISEQLSSVVQFSAKVGFENSLVGGPFISFCRG
ncbi:hypothetical protein sphantq_01980 [Sphingobium sp. AntQ-1]|nr:hypothetical protein sphantq_01980 [Sphingobium sp. AntQ-1]